MTTLTDGYPATSVFTFYYQLEIRGLPRCKNLTRFSLFVSFCFAVRYCLKCFCFLCFTSSVSFTGSYTEVKPKLVATSAGERGRVNRTA